LINLEFIKYVLKRCSGNISERIIWKSFFKEGKVVFSENDGCRKKFVEVQEEVAPFDVGLSRMLFFDPFKIWAG